MSYRIANALLCVTLLCQISSCSRQEVDMRNVDLMVHDVVGEFVVYDSRGSLIVAGTDVNHALVNVSTFEERRIYFSLRQPSLDRVLNLEDGELLSVWLADQHLFSFQHFNQIGGGFFVPDSHVNENTRLSAVIRERVIR